MPFSGCQSKKTGTAEAAFPKEGHGERVRCHFEKYENYKLKDTEDCGCLMYTEIEEMERLKGRLTGLSAGLQHIDNQLCELEESELCSNEQLWESKINMEKALADIRQWEVQKAVNTRTAK